MQGFICPKKCGELCEGGFTVPQEMFEQIESSKPNNKPPTSEAACSNCGYWAKYIRDPDKDFDDEYDVIEDGYYGRNKDGKIDKTDKQTHQSPSEKFLDRTS